MSQNNIVLKVNIDNDEVYALTFNNEILLHYEHFQYFNWDKNHFSRRGGKEKKITIHSIYNNIYTVESFSIYRDLWIPNPVNTYVRRTYNLNTDLLKDPQWYMSIEEYQKEYKKALKMNDPSEIIKMLQIWEGQLSIGKHINKEVKGVLKLEGLALENTFKNTSI